MMKSKRGIFALLCALVVALAVAACGSDNKDSGSSSTSGNASGSTLSDSTIKAALEFTGGKAGKADASLEPVTIGYVNQEAGTPAFPEYGITTQTAVDFVNNELGGIGGHPLKVEKCVIQTEEDGQKCASQFVNGGKVSMGILGLAVVGNKSFYDTVGGKFPVVVDVAATGPDATTPKVYTLDGGGIGVLNAMNVAVKNTGAKTAAILTTDNPAGKNTALQIQAPGLKALGIKPTVVLFKDTATTPEFAAAITNANAKNVDAILFSPSAPSQCVQLSQALKQLGVTTPVVTNVFCAADEVIEGVGSGLNGWVFASFGWNPRVPGNAQSDAFVNVMKAAGKSKETNSGYTFKSFADVMALTKLANEVGFDNISGDAMNKAILGFKGPAFMIEGELACGTNKTLISVCGNTGANSSYQDDAWKSDGTVVVGG